MKINKNSLQARIRDLSNKKDVLPNTILQDYFFDAFLKRLSKSKYANNFVFKGGYLLSSALGIDLRTTMDIDFLLAKLEMSRKNIETIFDEICKVDEKDNIVFSVEEINDIRQDDDYGGFNVSLLGKLENIRVFVNVDIATGDPITPSAITHKYRCLFDNEILSFPAYNFETIIAEKLQTVLVRGITNSRCKDFYDLYVINKLRWNDVNLTILREAFNNTCRHRGSVFSKESATTIINELEIDPYMSKRWDSFIKSHVFAKDIRYLDAIRTIKIIVKEIYNE